MGILGAMADTARAQASPTSFADLQRKVKPATMVSVTDDAGRTLRGTIASLSSSSLTLDAKNGRETLDQARVRELSVVRRNTGKGAGAGFGIGAAIGFLGILLTCHNCEDHSFAFAAAGAVMFGGLGAGIGAGIGASGTHEQLVYRAPVPQATSKFSVRPFTAPHGGGIAAALRF
jgi:hypothetical protein